MSALLSNFFQQLEGTHPRQKQTFVTNPELAAVRADVDRLQRNTEKLVSVIDRLFDVADKAAAAAPAIVEQYFADRGIKARLVATGYKRGTDQQAACDTVFGADYPACQNLMDSIFGGGHNG